MNGVTEVKGKGTTDLQSRMDSRINLGRGFPIQENDFQFVGSSWMPATPQKPIPTRSNFTMADRQGGQFGRVDLPGWDGVQGGFPQMLTLNEALYYNQMGRNGTNCMGDTSLFTRIRAMAPIAGPNSDTMYDVTGMSPNMVAQTAYANTMLGRNMSMARETTMPNLHSQVSTQRESEFSQIHCSSSRLLDRFNSPSQTNLYEYPVPYHTCYDLNSLPREADAAFSPTISSQFTPVTPHQGKILESMPSAMVNLPTITYTNEEKDKTEDVFLHREQNTSHTNSELLHAVLDSSSAVTSTALMEPANPDGGSDQVIDLNKTPEQKPPRRKKHRPKVIVEGKPKTTPKSSTPVKTNSKEKPPGKRKYVRKSLQESPTKNTESVEEAVNPSTGKRAYARIESLDESAIQHEDSTWGTINPSTSAGKWKYVQKKSLKESAIQLENSTGKTTEFNAGKNFEHQEGLEQAAMQHGDANRETAYCSPGTAQKSCRRTLNFESENTRGVQNLGAAQQQEHPKESLNLNVGFESPELCSDADKLYNTKSVSQVKQQNWSLLENQHSVSMSNLIKFMNPMQGDRTPIPDTQITSAKLDSLNATRKNLNCSTISRNRETAQQVQTAVSETFFPAKSDCRSYERARQMASQLNPQSEGKMPSFLLEARGLQTELYHSEQRRLCSPNPTCSSLLRQERIHVEGYNRNGNISSATCLETHKRRKMYDGTRADSFEMLSSFEIDKVSRPGSNCTRSLDATAFMFRTNYDKSSQFRSDSAENRGHGGSNSLVGNLSLPMMASGHYLPQQHNPLQPDAWRERMERANRSSQVNNLVLLPLTKTCAMPPPTDPRSGPSPEKQQQPNIANYKTSGEFQTMGSSTLAISMQSEKVSMRQPQKDVLEDHQQSSAKQRGQPSKQKLADQIEEVICQLEGLSINNQQNALVPYRGGDGTIIPYAGSQLKKHKPRPKVDLDPETDRVWKLLMGKEGSEGVEASDKEKEQWWQNEREVFRLRVDSFIARMHLVQGDRRFSKWKGSVVDSVIGVFLTQNVSDHLSSSAFMSLASLFPPKSRENRACHREKRSVVVQEPDDCIVNPTDTIKNREDLSFSVYNRSSMTNPTPTSMFEREVHCVDEEVISSQDSVDSVIIQANEGVISYSGLNSEAEDPASVCRPCKIQNFSYTDLLMSTAHFDEYSSPISGGLLFQEGSGDGLEKPEVDNANHRSNFTSFKSMDYPYVLNHQMNHNNANMKVSIDPSSAYMSQPTTQPVVQEAVLRFHGEESTCSWPSTASAFIKERQASCTSTMVGQRVEGAGNMAAEQYRSPRFQKIPIMDLHQKPICEQSTSSPYRSQSHECRNDLQLDSTQAVKPVNHTEAVVTTQNTHRQPTPRNTGNVFDIEESINSVDERTRFNYKLVAQNSKEQVHSTDMKHIEGSAKTLKARKGKAEGEKKDATDWDSLRRQVPENRRKERSEATMDSLDYEALRSARVKEISDAIKERGMNNMLAERIKEFLDRVVSEHGSTDLEWLRDVPPDKAKEYLLSVRGLGLKSVECVRLLTLHHLAFPVDTNVGRIAVRLGWVPLQPLPESLQLHLLELYPILETIQKYLWPRLCKLDQRTLYELHYQMITFGKVFCTKSRPNCNACPMRAECRHFASAFASARLSLPGPEDKSITISAAPFFTGRSPGVVINSLLLPPPEDKSLTRTGSYISKCVPIVEEPATPEQNQYEVTESDIEDAFYEDPDEIPTIELNIEKFTRNLQDYMQGSMDIKEADLSKALVVLNQNAASIPQPKLKNISRLRTEHQVYELPDSHPLLKGMDKREPDDPSPYLLAIWAPGETANSINAPEQLCQSQESGKLCHDNTCFSCNSVREASSQTVRGTILIPCRTAMRGSFPLNGTYFQVNEVFADHKSSLNPISVPRQWIWNLPRRMVFFGTSVSTIFKGLSTEEIQFCFWKAFVCVRGFDQETRAPRPLKARLHFPISKLTKTKNQKT